MRVGNAGPVARGMAAMVMLDTIENVAAFAMVAKPRSDGFAHVMKRKILDARKLAGSRKRVAYAVLSKML